MMNYSDELKKRTVAAGQYTRERDYWMKKLSGDLTKSTFPYDSREKGKGERTMAALAFRLTDPVYSGLMKISSKSDVRLHIILVAGWSALLHRYAGSTDIIAGIPVYKQEVDGQLINTVLAVRNTVTGEMTMKELLLQVGQTILEANQNQNYPIETLVYKLNVPETGEDFPLFDISILLEELHDKRYLRDIRQNTVVSFRQSLSAIEGVMEYNSQVYRESFMQRVVEHFRHLLAGALADVNIPISQIEILTEQERKQLLEDFNDNTAAFPRDKTVLQLIEEQAQRTPDRIACVGANLRVRPQCLSFNELNNESNRLAGLLKEKGVASETIAAVMMERSIEMVESILAVWKAGGAYLPMDPSYPQERIDYMLKDSGVEILVSGDCRVTDLCRGEPLCSPGLSLHPGNLAYIIYTSGSTGKPKGAMVEHTGMMNHMLAKIDTLQITGKSIVAQNASQTFDISVWQFFAAPVQGGRTVIYPDPLILDPAAFITRLIKDGVTVLEVVPSYLSVLLDVMAGGTLNVKELPALSLDYLLVTGEEIKPKLAARWFDLYPHIKMVNAYGPTEASDDITHYVMDGSPVEERIPIGSPIRNLTVYIVDRYMKLCPVGVSGELCVSGVGVGRGYINNPQLTAEKFFDLTAKTREDTRIRKERDMSHLSYRTGDLAKWLPDGNIQFLGRIDHQVKIRGFRVELGEIENLLTGHPQVKEAVVIEKELSEGKKSLCAYIVGSDSAASSQALNSLELKDYLARSLPDYMVPAHFVKLQRIPLTPSGKIDRNALGEAGTTSAAIPYISEEMLSRMKLVPVKEEKYDQDLKEVDRQILSEEERQKILFAFNDTAVDYPKDKSIHRLIEEQAERTPDHIAVVGGVRPLYLTYAELDNKSGQMACLLREKGVKPGTIAGIMPDRTVEMVIGILAILKAGGAYLPIDPVYPQERVDYMLADSGADVFVNGESEITVLSRGEPLCSPGFSLHYTGNLAYIIYTSGTTGKPKGTAIEHCSVVNFIKGMTDIIDFRENDNVFSLITISFDIFVMETLVPLAAGAAVVIGGVGEQSDTRSAASALERHDTTVFQLTPSMLRLFLSMDESFKSLKPLRYLLVGGEVFPQPLLEKARKATTGNIFNLYGPTETTIWSTAKDVTGDSPLNIGKPIANTQVYILSESLGLQPVGVPGELCIGGAGVGRGYLNRPELTSEKFFDLTAKTREDTRIRKERDMSHLSYRTGDLAKWLPDGNIQFLGRKDHQVQLWGIRVEPGEIESILLKHHDLDEAVVVVRRDKKGDDYLLAAVVSKKIPAKDRLREYLAGELPQFMIPARFLHLEKMPLTPNGKINRKILESIDIEGMDLSLIPEVEYIEPKTGLEIRVAEIWKEVLNTGRVGIHDNFFDLGGNSLGIIQVNVKLKEAFKRDIPALILFEYPTVASLVNYLEQDAASGTASREDRKAIKSKGRNKMHQRRGKLKHIRGVRNEE